MPQDTERPKHWETIEIRGVWFTFLLPEDWDYQGIARGKLGWFRWDGRDETLGERVDEFKKVRFTELEHEMVMAVWRARNGR